MNTEDSKNDRASEEQALLALRAGLGYGPAADALCLIDAIQAEQRHQIVHTLAIPAILGQYFAAEAETLGMTATQLMVRILETHRFANRQHQHLVSAIARKRAALRNREAN